MPSTPPEAPAPMRIAVIGVWHLGVVIAACLAEAGFDVVGVDPDPVVVSGLQEGKPPVAEPGLEALINAMRAARRLRFASADNGAASEAEVLWVAFDTPVDEHDRADSAWVLDHAATVLARARQGALVVVSSQLPVGSVAALAGRLAASGRDDLLFSCIPENLRLGSALDTFRSPERFVAGVRDADGRAGVSRLLAPFAAPIEWMGIESAEMTKHALNAFLATSVAFINELACVCEAVGADAAEVSRGLKTERRIGPAAYLSPGDVFAGGTLARDLNFLGQLARDNGLPAALIDGVSASNEAHRDWSRRALEALLCVHGSEGEDTLAGRRIAVWGLTYKPGTDTLRRSSALELCRWLHGARATVRAHDPAVRSLPSADANAVELAADPLAAVAGADALVVCTPWPEYLDVAATDVVAAMAEPIVLDPGGHLRATLGEKAAIRYARVGVRPR